MADSSSEQPRDPTAPVPPSQESPPEEQPQEQQQEQPPEEAPPPPPVVDDVPTTPTESQVPDEVVEVQKTEEVVVDRQPSGMVTDVELPEEERPPLPDQPIEHEQPPDPESTEGEEPQVEPVAGSEILERLAVTPMDDETLKASLDNLDAVALTSMLSEEQEKEEPRQWLVEEIENRLAWSVSVSNETNEPGAENLPERPEEASPENLGPYYEEVIDKVKEFNEDPTVGDPALPDLSTLVPDDRDVEQAAIDQESPTSSNVDDFGAKGGLIQQAAEPIKEATNAAYENATETEVAHSVSSVYADAGEPYPIPEYVPPSEEERLEEEEKVADDAEVKALEQLEEVQTREDSEDVLTVPHLREDAPAPAGTGYDVIADTEMEPIIPVPESTPSVVPIGVGTMVSRQDESHAEIGVIVRVDAAGGSIHTLVKVAFPTEGEGWLAPANLKYEGHISFLLND